MIGLGQPPAPRFLLELPNCPVDQPSTPPQHDPTPDVFSVPRRFDMATVLVAMLGYSLLFGGMLMLDAWPSVIALFGAFFAFVAVGQAFAIRSGRPREASIIAGTIFWFLVACGMLTQAPLDPCTFVSAVFTAAVAGPIAGYLAGTLVGGVFLISHYLREADLLRRRAPHADNEEASPWGPLPKPVAAEADDHDWPVMEVVSSDEDGHEI